MDEKKYWDKVTGMIPDSTLKVGKLTAYNLLTNTNHLFFSLSRYKFAAKMVGAQKRILELGCSEGVGSLLLAQNSCEVTAIDFDKKAITWAKKNLQESKVDFRCDSFLGKSYGQFDAVVSLDVIEHILKKNESSYLQTIWQNITPTGMCVVGTPNVAAVKYASKASKEGHVNNFSAERLRKLFLKKFRNVFVFGMNDEIVHTGFYPMSHYLMVLACFPRENE